MLDIGDRTVEKIISLYKTFDIFEGSSAVVLSWITKIEEGANKVRSVYRLWRKRQIGRAQLAQLSYRELQDIGLNRHDVDCEINKPFWKE